MKDKEAILRSLEEIGRPASAKQIYTHIVEQKYLSPNSKSKAFNGRLKELWDDSKVDRKKEENGSLLYFLTSDRQHATNTGQPKSDSFDSMPEKKEQGARKYYKIAPGPQASEWNKFYDEGLIAVNFSGINSGDLSKFNSWDELNLAVGKTKSSNETMNLWDFKSADVGDVIFVNKGVNMCIGIGIIESDYYYDDTVEVFRHRRRVKWITDKVYEYTSFTLKDYKTLFRPDTFTKTYVGEFLLSEYAKNHPELIPLFDENNLRSHIQAGVPAVLEEPTGGTSINFWWLNANPAIWKIDETSVGQKQTYTTHNEEGNKRRIYKHFESVKPGDLMIGYESSPTKQIKAMYKITKGIHNASEGEEIEFELIEKFATPIHWDEIKDNTALKSCEVIINNQGSLFHLTTDEFKIIKQIIAANNNIGIDAPNKIGTYNFTEDPDKPFISEADFYQAVALLKRKKNIILQGPPGVGKTFIARKLAYEIMHEMRDANIEMVQFHQSYSYEDFIQGLRPTAKGGFDLRNGIFYSFCQKAIADPTLPYFFIIDEINRGNLSKVFGELMMLIEADKRHEKFALKLTYSENERFYIPENLFIIGTMNTADGSLAIVDYALRRRFAFYPLHPDYGETFRSFLSAKRRI